MIIYNVTINIDNNVREEWLRWMQEVHIPDVMRTGLFSESKILKLLTEEAGNPGTTYAIQYTCPSMEAYEQYENLHAPALQRVHQQRYKDQFVAFRSLLEVVPPPNPLLEKEGESVRI